MKLKKCLYSLMQSPQKWYKKFDAFMRSQYYNRSNENSCLYMKKYLDSTYVILILYVDGMHMVSKNKDELSMLKKKSQTFDVKNLGDAKHVVSMHITRVRSKSCIYSPSIFKKVLNSRCLMWKV